MHSCDVGVSTDLREAVSQAHGGGNGHEKGLWASSSDPWMRPGNPQGGATSSERPSFSPAVTKHRAATRCGAHMQVIASFNDDDPNFSTFNPPCAAPLAAP